MREMVARPGRLPGSAEAGTAAAVTALLHLPGPSNVPPSHLQWPSDTRLLALRARHFNHTKNGFAGEQCVHLHAGREAGKLLINSIPNYEYVSEQVSRWL
jgi:hypothetical protein